MLYGLTIAPFVLTISLVALKFLTIGLWRNLIVLQAHFSTCDLFLDANIEMMSDVGAIRLILHALKNHKKEAKVVKNACMAVATISEADGKKIFIID